MLTERTATLARRTASTVGRLFPTLFFFWICGLDAGCGDSDLPPGLTKKAVAIDEVPDGVRSAAKTANPKVNFKEAWQNLDRQGKLHSYEIRGRQESDGQIREVRVSTTGEILESENEPEATLCCLRAQSVPWLSASTTTMDERGLHPCEVALEFLL